MRIYLMYSPLHCLGATPRAGQLGSQHRDRRTNHTLPGASGPGWDCGPGSGGQMHQVGLSNWIQGITGDSIANSV